MTVEELRDWCNNYIDRRAAHTDDFVVQDVQLQKWAVEERKKTEVRVLLDGMKAQYVPISSVIATRCAEQKVNEQNQMTYAEKDVVALVVNEY